MAKFASCLLYTCRIQSRCGMLRRQFSCKLCQKSCPSICFSSIVRLGESRRFSTNSLVFQQKRTKLVVNGNTENDVRYLLDEQKQLLQSVIEKGDPLSSAGWDELKCKIFDLRGQINSFNFDAVAMGFCIEAKQYKIGFSLFDHIATLGKEANRATLSRFLRLCYVCHSAPVPKDVQAVVALVYSKLCSFGSLMDGSTAENAIHGLVLTDKWKEGIELLPMIKLTGVPSSSTYNVLAKAAFDYNDHDTGWELMHEMVLNGRRPTPSTYCALLNFCMRCPNKDDGHEMVEKLLSFFADNDLRPTKDVAENLRSWFKKENPNWKSSMTTLNNNGLCKSCKNNLEPITITKEEFGALRSCFIDRVVVGSNVFLKTTPEELKNFQKFLERSVPYDVVIDGLNVAHSAKSNKNAPHSAYLLQTVVKHFLNKSQKVVLIGRKHMQSWPKRPMNFIFSNTKPFLANNISQDDPFLLYATMYGGLGTHFVSRDLMRGHMFLLKDPSLKSVFKRWQQQHQFFIVYIAEEGDVHLKPPLSYNPSVQRRADGGWHIPYDEEFLILPPQTLDPPVNWLCLGPRPERKKSIKTA